jgi:hypothetical protein
MLTHTDMTLVNFLHTPSKFSSLMLTVVVDHHVVDDDGPLMDEEEAGSGRHDLDAESGGVAMHLL